MLIVGASINQIKEIKQVLGNQFNISNLDPCYYYLKMSILCDQPQWLLFVGQHGYVKRVLRNLSILKAKPAATLIDTIKLEAKK